MGVRKRCDEGVSRIVGWRCAEVASDDLLLPLQSPYVLL